MDMAEGNSTEEVPLAATEGTSKSALGFAILQSLPAAPILFGNILVILAIRRTPCLQTVTNYFVMSLAVADLLVGLIIPFNRFILLYSECTQLASICTVNVMLLLLPCLLSVNNLLLIVVDRHQAIVYPLHYPRRITPARAKALIFTSWVLNLLFVGTMLLYNKNSPSTAALEDCQIFNVLMPHSILTICAYCCLVVLVMLVLYAHIFYVAYKNAAKVWAQTTSSNANTVHGAMNFVVEAKTAKTLCIVLGAFIVSYLPFMVTVVLLGIDEVSGIPSIFAVSLALLLSNSCVNPVIYTWRNKDFRIAFKRLLLRWRATDQH